MRLDDYMGISTPNLMSSSNRPQASDKRMPVSVIIKGLTLGPYVSDALKWDWLPLSLTIVLWDMDSAKWIADNQTMFRDAKIDHSPYS